MDTQESATKPKLGAKVSQVATFYHPRTWKEKGLWWTLGLFVVTYLVLVLVLGLLPGGLMALCADAVVRALAS